VVPPNVPRPKEMGEMSPVEVPPATPNIRMRQQQREAGTPLIDGKRTINWEFNKRRNATKRAKSTRDLHKHGQITPIQIWNEDIPLTLDNSQGRKRNEPQREREKLGVDFQEQQHNKNNETLNRGKKNKNGNKENIKQQE
jgi:hypothetical protein